VESTALVARFLSEGRSVIPVHVSCGLIWDEAETRWVRRFCAAQACDRLASLIEIPWPLTGFFRNHWAVTGQGIPPAGAAASQLEIPMRNLSLLGFSVHWLKHVPRYQMAMGTTADNHYPDGSRDYFDKVEAVLSLEAGFPVQILTPFIQQTKTDVIRATPREVLAASFSCVNPQGDQLCGRCIKCGSRRAAFLAAGVDDPTYYAA
jgi:7-cyano-7-deazaguanine synthase in queuosine biosynthesis